MKSRPLSSDGSQTCIAKQNMFTILSLSLGLHTTNYSLHFKLTHSFLSYSVFDHVANDSQSGATGCIGYQQPKRWRGRTGRGRAGWRGGRVLDGRLSWGRGKRSSPVIAVCQASCAATTPDSGRRRFTARFWHTYNHAPAHWRFRQPGNILALWKWDPTSRHIRKL